MFRRFFVIGLSVCALLSRSQSANAATLVVNAGGNLQAALDAAQAGDTILLQAGATFTGNFKLPVKTGTSAITIRSAAPDSSLPPAGTRITPAFASLLPKIRSDQNGAALKTAAGAHNWRLLFLEFLPSVSNSSANLVEFGAAGTSQSTLSSVPQGLTADRCYFHGDASYGQRRGIALNSGDTQIVNSYFADFKGVGQDTQAIAGWNGPGPYLIENNYLEAAGENVMFGGSDPSIPNLVPSGIRIRRNLLSKPLAWISQSWTIKNLLEFKNAQDVVVEGNTIENNWAAGQQGYSILFTPRNQSNTAPWTVVKNITIQHNVIRHVAAVFNISGYDDEGVSQQTATIKILNNLIYDVSPAYQVPGQTANGSLAIIGNGPKDITFDHNTVDNSGNNTIYLYNGVSPTGTKIYGFTLTNNLLRDNSYGIFGDNSSEGSTSLAAYTPNAQVQRNAIAGASAKFYPTGNDYPTLAQWLADFTSVSTGHYDLVSTSLSNNAAADGKDIGVDFTALNLALAGSVPAPTPAPVPSPSPSGTGSKPYSGTPVALPGTIQMENYDVGGEGVAYHDTTSGNTGGAYRSNNIDIQPTTDAGGGYNLGWVKATEWLNYSVSVASTGNYAIDVRVASSGSGGTFHVDVDGANVTGPMTVPNTGGWQIWKTLSVNGVSIPSGPHVLRVVMDTNGASGSVGNFNWLQVR